jgi:Holliday junction resolvase RusA-like endonuclease
VTLLSFTVPGLPQGKGRARFGNGRTYTPAKTVAYEGLVALAGQQAMDGRAIVDGPVYLMVDAYFPIPKSWPAARRRKALSSLVWHVAKPDGDNILKAAGDALNGIVWHDDSQVAFAKITKQYAEAPRLVITVEALSHECL